MAETLPCYFFPEFTLPILTLDQKLRKHLKTDHFSIKLNEILLSRAVRSRGTNENDFSAWFTNR